MAYSPARARADRSSDHQPHPDKKVDGLIVNSCSMVGKMVFRARMVPDNQIAQDQRRFVFGQVRSPMHHLFDGDGQRSSGNRCWEIRSVVWQTAQRAMINVAAWRDCTGLK